MVMHHISGRLLWTLAFHSFEKSQELVKATWDCDEEKVAELLEWFHDQTSNKTYNELRQQRQEYKW